MDNGAGSYRRFLDGDDEGIVEIVGDYKDGLILFLNGYVKNIFLAEELTEDTFFRLIVKKPRYSGMSQERREKDGGDHVRARCPRALLSYIVTENDLPRRHLSANAFRGRIRPPAPPSSR